MQVIGFIEHSRLGLMPGRELCLVPAIGYIVARPVYLTNGGHMGTATPAVAKADRWIRARLASAEYARRRLPSLSSMAQQAGVSRMSMVRAVKRLTQQGLLRTVYGKGVFPTGVVPAPQCPSDADDSDKQLKFEVVARRVWEDIVSGHFVRGEKLPPAKLLCERYGCSAATVRKALRMTQEQGYTTPVKRSYAITPWVAADQRNTLVLISRGDSDTNRAFPSPLSYGNMINLEHECSRHGLALRYVAYDTAGDRLVGKGEYAAFPAHVPVRQTILGVVVWTMALDETQLTRLFSALRTLRAPVAIYDEMGIMAGIPLSQRPARHCVFAEHMSYRAGVRVGRACLDRGHRGVAYISLGPNAATPDRRWHGLEHTFASRGNGCQARFITGDEPRSARANRVVTQRVLEAIGARLHADMQQAALDGRNSAALWDALRLQVDLIYRQLWALPILIRKFQTALADDAVSAWVLFNDDVTFRARNFLESRGTQVPRDLSLVGFDNSELAYAHGLASYRFNNQALTSALVSYLLGADMPPRLKSSPHNVDIDGEVLNHGSLRQV